MKTEQKYRTAQSMRVALEQRLNRTARDKDIDVMRLRRRVAFDRLLTRFFCRQTNDLIVKGGYALELRIQSARTTKDIDISFKGSLQGVRTGERLSEPNALQDLLQELADIDTKDFFEFVIGSAILDLENAPYAGYRYPVEARMAGRVFIKFELDVAAGDPWVEPHETVGLGDWFAFAGIEAGNIPVISKEQQFAEKVHAYTLPRKTPNSRVKDLVDILLLIERGNLDSDRTAHMLVRTFERRRTHPIPSDLPPAPDSWNTPFRKLAVASQMAEDVQTAIATIRKFYQALLARLH